MLNQSKSINQLKRLKFRPLLAFAAAGALPLFARAGTTRLWIADSSDWSVATNWLSVPGATSGVPTTGDDAYLSQIDLVDRIVNFDGSYIPPSSLNSLTIDATGLGTMTLSQTSANVFSAASEMIGDTGSGFYDHSNGTNGALALYLGFNSTGSGTYSLSNTGNLAIATGLYVGFAGSGVMNQTGGNVTVAPGGELVLGYIAGANGTYNLSGGALSAPGMRIGDDNGAAGQFVQTGGAATITNDLEVASSGLLGTGSMTISGGTLAVGRNLILGEVGSGSINQSAGTVTVSGGGTNGLIIGWSPISGTNPASIGTYTLSGTGLLSVTGRTYVGFAGNGDFMQTGGTHNIDGSLIIAATTGTNTSSASYVLQGGALNVSGAGVIQLNSGGTFTQTGGALTFGSFNMDGGTVNGTLTNGGIFNYTAGTFNGRLANAAGSAANFNADFVAGNGMDNATSIAIDMARTITLDGAGLANSGTILLLGGVLNGAGLLSSSGTIGGFGEIGGSGGFNNSGVWNIAPGDISLTNTGANTTSGTLTIPADPIGITLALDAIGVELDNTGTINLNNNSTITGDGLLVNKTTGTINAAGATISSTFINQGQLNVGIGGSGDLEISNPSANLGTIQLTSNNNLTGALITNSGIIDGTGTITNAINNTGIVSILTPGSLTITGALQNQTTGTLNVGNGSTMTANLTANAGTIDVASGGQFSAGTFTNTGAINVNGTLDVDGVINTGSITYGGVGSVDSHGPITNGVGGSIILAATGPSVVFFDDITHNPGATFAINSGATASFLGNIAGGGDLANNGTINLSGGKTYTLGIISGAGSTTLVEGAHLTATRINQGSLTINASGTAVAVVSITPAVTPGASTSKVNTLSITGDASPAAKLDLSNTNLAIDYSGSSPLATIRAQLKSAYNESGAHWTGNGITSSTAAATSGRALGYAEASDALGLSGAATADWFGQTVDATSLLIRYTRAGDADLNGTVGFPDLVKVAQHYGDSTGNRTWFDGDFNYDGNIDFTDLVLVAQNYDGSLPAAPVGALSSGFIADLAKAESVPEPSAIGFAFAGVMTLLTRRRRKRS